MKIINQKKFEYYCNQRDCDPMQYFTDFENEFNNGKRYYENNTLFQPIFECEIYSNATDDHTFHDDRFKRIVTSSTSTTFVGWRYENNEPELCFIFMPGDTYTLLDNNEYFDENLPALTDSDEENEAARPIRRKLLKLFGLAQKNSPVADNIIEYYRYATEVLTNIENLFADEDDKAKDARLIAEKAEELNIPLTLRKEFLFENEFDFFRSLILSDSAYFFLTAAEVKPLTDEERMQGLAKQFCVPIEKIKQIAEKLGRTVGVCDCL